ncbi:unnamed protein product [Prorocentrum cordatum]|uniref:J domain-containing protein n=1 Tax=Prorocentrum cordatum TaxID=2364126 RepID=A0ABN9VH93_9DINO|nr:unnamed protein product [Polarella glacialis]
MGHALASGRAPPAAACGVRQQWRQRVRPERARGLAAASALPAPRPPESAAAARGTVDARRPAPVTAERVLTDTVARAESLEELHAALWRHGEALSLRGCTSALCSLARLATRGKLPTTRGGGPSRAFGSAQPAEVVPAAAGQGAEGARSTAGARGAAAEVALAARLAPLVADGREPLAARTVASLLWALAKLAQRPPFDGLALPLCRRAARELPPLSGRDAAQVLWAAAVMDLGNSTNGIVDLAASVLQGQAGKGELGHRDLAQSLWAAAHLQESGVPGMLPLALALARAAHGCSGEQLLAELTSSAALSLPTMTPVMVSNCAWGAARAGVPAGPFYDAVAAAASRHLRQGNPALTDQHVCNIVWAFTKVSAQSPMVLEHMLVVGEECCRRGQLARMESHHVAGVAWGLTKAFAPEHLPSESSGAVLPEPVRRLVADAAGAALLGVQRFGADLAWVVWSVARATLRDQAVALFSPVVERLAAMPPGQVGIQDFTMLSWALATADMSRHHLPAASFDVLTTEVLRGLRGGQPGADRSSFLAVMAWACARADLRGAAVGIVEAAAAAGARALASRDSTWSLRHLTMVAWAAVVQGQQRGASARFVFDAYVYAAGRLGLGPGGGGVDNPTEHVGQLALIGAALRCEPEYASACEGVRLPRVARRLHVTESDFQREVEESLRGVLARVGGSSHLQVEAVAPGGISMDLALGRREHLLGAPRILERGAADVAVRRGPARLGHVDAQSARQPAHPVARTAAHKESELLRAGGNQHPAARSHRRKLAREVLDAMIEQCQDSNVLAGGLFCERAKCNVRLKDWRAVIKDVGNATYRNHELVQPCPRRGEASSPKSPRGTPGALESLQDAVKELESLFSWHRDQATHDKLQEAKFLLRKHRRPNFYDLLGCPSVASHLEIKKAYRERAAEWHPDKKGHLDDAGKKNAEEMFKRIGEAYEILTDPQKKELYDKGYDLEGIDEQIQIKKQRTGMGGCCGMPHRH